MGPKGTHVQGITQDHDVSIKFPEREKPGNQSTSLPNGDGGGGGASPNPPEGVGGAHTVNGEGEEEGEKAVNPRHIILITGRKENAEAAKQSLMVSWLFVFLACFPQC